MIKIKKFAERCSVEDTSRYSGWCDFFSVCDESRHWEVAIPQGAFCNSGVRVDELGPCDRASCVRGELLDEATLPPEAQRRMGILGVVPDGKVVVVQHSHDAGQETCHGVETFSAGSPVPVAYLNGIGGADILSDGESVEVSTGSDSIWGSGFRYYRIINHGGEVVEDDSAQKAEEAAERKAFAREAHAALVAAGFSAPHAARIMRVAGPGQVEAALEWYKQLQDRGVDRDIILAVLGGLVTTPYGRARRLSVISGLGWPDLPGRTSTIGGVTGVMQGVLAMILR